MSICTGIEKLESKAMLGDLLRVTFDDLPSALWFYDYAEAMKFLNKEVIVDFRMDIYNGIQSNFINTFTIPTVINTLDKQENIKLYLDQVDNQSNLSFNEIADGESRQGCIVFCTSCEFKSSGNATWQELIIRDKSMHTAKLRLFNYDNKAANFAGKYVMTELIRNQYGFRSELISPVPGEVAANPELDIAEQFIKNYFSTDVIAMQYIAKYNLLDNMKNHVDYEMGYSLVRMAMELSMVDSMHNITKDVDLEAIGEAIMLSYGHLCKNSVLSPSVNNITMSMGFNWNNKVVVLQLLDDALVEKPAEAKVYQSIKNCVAALLEVRKGTLS